MQEARRLHLRCCSFELHGREGWGLQAGNHWQRESVCNHGIRHCSAERLPLETAYWPGAVTVPWRRWVKWHNTLLHSLLSIGLHFCLAACSWHQSTTVCARSAGKRAYREELISCISARSLRDTIITLHTLTRFLRTQTSTQLTMTVTDVELISSPHWELKSTLCTHSEHSVMMS